MNNMNKIFTIIAAIFALASCSASKQLEASDLVGKWAIVKAMDISTEGAERHAFIEFDNDGRMNGNASVNTFFGGYELKGNQLTFSNIGMTMMMGASMDIEQAITKALDGSVTVKSKGNTLYFLNSNKKTIMTLEKE